MDVLQHHIIATLSLRGGAAWPPRELEEVLLRVASDAGLTAFRAVSQEVSGGSFAVVIVAESHIAVLIRGDTASVEISTCSDEISTFEALRLLADALDGEVVHATYLRTGLVNPDRL